MKLFIPATIAAAVVALGGIGYAIWNAPVSTNPVTTDTPAVDPAEQALPDVNLPITPHEAINERGAYFLEACELILKSSLRDPSSYQNISRKHSYSPGSTTPNLVSVNTDITYRARNGFNGYNVSTHTCFWSVWKGRVDGKVKYGHSLDGFHDFGP